MQQHVHFHDEYDPFLANSDIDPLRSYAFHRLQIDFFRSIAAPQVWSFMPQSGAFNRPTFTPLNTRLSETEPNFEKIRSAFPLQRSPRRLDRSLERQSFWLGMTSVLTWFYGDTVTSQQTLWFVESAPLPLLILGKSFLFPSYRFLLAVESNLTTCEFHRDSSDPLRHESICIRRQFGLSRFPTIPSRQQPKQTLRIRAARSRTAGVALSHDWGRQNQ
jgi:hypothetical protein